MSFHTYSVAPTWVLVRSGLACYGKPWRGEDWAIQNGLSYEGIPLGTVPLWLKGLNPGLGIRLRRV